jgi:REP element-mobilizing transposase RayT
MSQTGMLQRCWEHDYRAPCFYMLTIVTEPRRDCLGKLVVAGDGEARVELSPMGEAVCEVWRRTSAVYRGVESCECVAMPDHFHGILWVKERLARPMGHIVKAFKRVCELECRSRGLLLPPNPAAAPAGSVPAAAPAAGLWQEGYQDTILLHRGQLRAMMDYIADNPRRLAAKRANPALFTVAATLEVAPGKSCAAIGNRFLLQHPLKRQVQVSRRVSPEELAVLRDEALHAAAHGTVLVSPCISPGEKAIARAALEAGRPLVVLLANGFAPHYKPPGRYFDACAAGRLLMLAPFPYQRQRQTITRSQCLELNAWAEAVCGSPCGLGAGGSPCRRIAASSPTLPLEPMP